jgi:hypothetical protein
VGFGGLSQPAGSSRARARGSHGLQHHGQLRVRLRRARVGDQRVVQHLELRLGDERLDQEVVRQVRALGRLGHLGRLEQEAAAHVRRSLRRPRPGAAR